MDCLRIGDKDSRLRPRPSGLDSGIRGRGRVGTLNKPHSGIQTPARSARSEFLVWHQAGSAIRDGGFIFRTERSQCLYVSTAIPGRDGASRSEVQCMPTLARILISLCVGAAAILAWQSYGDAARKIITGTYPQLGWLVPRTARIAYSAPDGIGLAAQAAPSLDQRLNAISLALLIHPK